MADTHKMDNEKSVYLDNEEHVHKGAVGGKRVVMYTYDSNTDTLVPFNSSSTGLTDTELRAVIPDTQGTWGYKAGVSGTVTLTGGKRVLSISAVAQELAASFTIDGGDSVVLPYGSTDKASSAITIEPKANLTDPTIIFTGTKSYFIEYVV